MRGSLSSPSYLVRNPTLTPQLEKTHHTPLSLFYTVDRAFGNDHTHQREGADDRFQDHGMQSRPGEDRGNSVDHEVKDQGGVKQIAPVGICCMMQGAQTVGSVTTYSGGMGWEARGRFKTVW